MPRKFYTKEEFIEKANAIYNNKYNYDNVIYINCNKAVSIICSKHGKFNHVPTYHLTTKRGCPLCYKFDIFVKKCIKKYGKKYDYSKFIYTKRFAKSIIICPTHGDVLLNADFHLRKGCLNCEIDIKNKKIEEKRQKDFIKFKTKANLKHNFKYDYSEFIYLAVAKKGKIFCPRHNFYFWQTPDSHLKHGCIKCGIEIVCQKTNKSKVFEKEAKAIHGDKYDYSKVKYSNLSTKVEIICKVHGSFFQGPDSHLMGRGCQKCSKKYRPTTIEFIQNANKIHEHKYTYDKFIYVTCKSVGFITCSIHGDFKQNASTHLSGAGCPKCCNNISRLEVKWLNELNIINRNPKININGRIIKPDGFDPDTNTIYEFYGDFWHGNPKLYNPNDINIKNKSTFGELYNATLVREKIIKDAGYNLVTIWESDFLDKKGKL